MKDSQPLFSREAEEIAGIVSVERNQDLFYRSSLSRPTPFNSDFDREFQAATLKWSEEESIASAQRLAILGSGYKKRYAGVCFEFNNDKRLDIAINGVSETKERFGLDGTLRIEFTSSTLNPKDPNQSKSQLVFNDLNNQGYFKVVFENKKVSKSSLDKSATTMPLTIADLILVNDVLVDMETIVREASDEPSRKNRALL
jgi:hypothetical protein